MEVLDAPTDVDTDTKPEAPRDVFTWVVDKMVQITIGTKISDNTKGFKNDA